MKFNAALTLFLALGPATILAAPVNQADNAVAAGGAGGAGASPAGASSAAGPAAAGGSASQGMSGQSSGNEGLLDKVEKILKDVLGSLRKRGLVKEVADAVKEDVKTTLDETSKLLNGEKSGSQSSFASQSSDPHAATNGAPAAAAAPASQGQSQSQDGSSSGGGSPLSQLLGGRSDLNPLAEADSLNTAGATSPITGATPLAVDSEHEPALPSAPIPGMKFARGADPAQLPEEVQGLNNGAAPSTGAGDGITLTPDDIATLEEFLAESKKSQAQTQAQTQEAQIPGDN